MALFRSSSMHGIRLLILLSLGWCITSSMNAQNTGTIRGIVTDKKSGSPLPFVNVVVKGTNAGASTNMDGGFEIRGLPAATYTITASLVGHETRQVTDVVVVAGGAATVDITLVDASVQVGDITVYGASLRGEKVTDAPAAVSVLAPGEIKLNAVSGQLPKLLENQPGVDIAQSGISPSRFSDRRNGTVFPSRWRIWESSSSFAGPVPRCTAQMRSTE